MFCCAYQTPRFSVSVTVTGLRHARFVTGQCCTLRAETPKSIPARRTNPSVGMYVIIGCSSRDEKRLLSLFYLEGFYDATQFASLPSL